jgi:hypothetical protein
MGPLVGKRWENNYKNVYIAKKFWYYIGTAPRLDFSREVFVFDILVV